MERSGTVIKECVAQNSFSCFMEGGTSLKDKQGSGRPAVEDAALLEMVEQQPSTSTCILLAELGFHKASSIDSSISLALRSDAKIWNSLKNQKTFHSA